MHLVIDIFIFKLELSDTFQFVCAEPVLWVPTPSTFTPEVTGRFIVHSARVCYSITFIFAIVSPYRRKQFSGTFHFVRRRQMGDWYVCPLRLRWLTLFNSTLQVGDAFEVKTNYSATRQLDLLLSFVLFGQKRRPPSHHRLRPFNEESCLPCLPS